MPPGISAATVVPETCLILSGPETAEGNFALSRGSLDWIARMAISARSATTSDLNACASTTGAVAPSPESTLNIMKVAIEIADTKERNHMANLA